MKMCLTDISKCIYYYIPSAFVTHDIYKCACLYIKWWCYLLAYVLISYW